MGSREQAALLCPYPTKNFCFYSTLLLLIQEAVTLASGLWSWVLPISCLYNVRIGESRFPDPLNRPESPLACSLPNKFSRVDRQVAK